MNFADHTKLDRKSGEAEGSAVPRTLPGNVFRQSVAGFPATQHWTKARVRVSLKERRMRSANATNVHRKSGVAERRDLQCARLFDKMSM